ncbi:MAG: cell division protein ZapE [Alphaproteobacteria bacterium]
MSETPLAAYRALVREGTIERDPAQELAAEKLNLLHRRLKVYKPLDPGEGGLFSRLGFGRTAPEPSKAPQGLYLVGGVGRGKSMIIDLFFDLAPVTRKRRLHFHAFMIEIHDRINAARNAGGADPIPAVAHGFAEDTWLLCFDEFQVNDPVDALILDRLFNALFERGVVMVATSNVAPRDLYAGGLNRDRFLPFLDLIAERLDVMELDAGIDYRRGRMESMAVYFTPLGAASAAALDAAYLKLTNNDPGEPGEIVLRGRTVAVPTAVGGVARFSFAELCETPLGAADYIAIAELYHTLVLADVPRLTPEKRNEATRFVTLIDALYEHKVKLVCTADMGPEDLYPEGDGSFAFARTVSRLHEMQSDDYMAAPHLT